MTMSESQSRDLHLLHIHCDTLSCALKGCVACCYKIVLYSRPGIRPNVRPEMCPRMVNTKAVGNEQVKAGKHCIGLYAAEEVKRILTVGDGNFSYSLALARALGPSSGVQLVATSHESQTSVVETYPDSEKILNELNAIPNVTVRHEVDATNAEQMIELGQFDRIIWNFPCVRAPRGEDGQNQEMEINKKLLHDFFAHVSLMLTSTGEVHVTHKTKAPFCQWGIENIAKTNKLYHKQSVIFDRCLYPGYTNKKVLSNSSFPILDSQTFIFVPEERAQVPADGEETTSCNDDKSNVPLKKVTIDILKKVYVLLTPSLDDIMKIQKRKRFRDSKGSVSDINHTDGGGRCKTSNKKLKRRQPALCQSKERKSSGRKRNHRS